MHMPYPLMRMRCRLAIRSGRPCALLILMATLAWLNCVWPTGSAAAQDAPDLAEDYTPGAIDWQPCPENAALECGTLTLPVDYRQPHGETFDMAVIRARALQASRRIGVLFTHPGIPVKPLLGAIS